MSACLAVNREQIKVCFAQAKEYGSLRLLFISHALLQALNRCDSVLMWWIERRSDAMSAASVSAASVSASSSSSAASASASASASSSSSSSKETEAIPDTSNDAVVAWALQFDNPSEQYYDFDGVEDAGDQDFDPKNPNRERTGSRTPKRMRSPSARSRSRSRSTHSKRQHSPEAGAAKANMKQGMIFRSARCMRMQCLFAMYLVVGLHCIDHVSLCVNPILWCVVWCVC
jgi:hypothetical protein